MSFAKPAESDDNIPAACFHAHSCAKLNLSHDNRPLGLIVPSQSAPAAVDFRVHGQLHLALQLNER